MLSGRFCEKNNLGTLVCEVPYELIYTNVMGSPPYSESNPGHPVSCTCCFDLGYALQ